MLQASAPGFLVRLFGFFEAHLNGVPMTGLRVRDAERLLALLALNHGRMLQSASLAATLWPETGSLESLRQSVTHLRSLLGEQGERLKSSKGGLFLDLEGAEVDVVAFDQAVASDNIQALRQALALYRGPLLLNWEEGHPEDQQWVIRAREKRREERREALKKVAHSCLLQGENEEAAGYLQQYVNGNPAEEWAWTHWMQALANSGERVSAMNVYRKCRDLFHGRFQLKPPMEMTRLYHQLQQQVVSDSDLVPQDQARLEPVGGAVPLHSSYYVVRAADSAMQAAITRKDALILLKGPRQTGKTSLLARGLQQARLIGDAIVVSDFQRISAQHWTSLDALLMALARSITEQLDLSGTPEDTWRSSEGPNENFERYLKREVLKKVSAPIVWGLDEVDRLFAYPFRNDIFGLFRSWFNDRALNPSSPWNQVTLAIVYATEAHLFITDLNQSPFNVGTRLPLEDFTIGQVDELNRKYGNPLGHPDPLARFMLLVGGNPYLVRRGLHEMTARALSMETFEEQALRDDGCYGDHLQRLMQSLSQDRRLCEAVLDLLQGKGCPSAESFYRLRSAGVLAGSEPENCRFRCRIYKNYLGAYLK